MSFVDKFKSLPKEYKLTEEDIVSIGSQDSTLDSIREFKRICELHNLKWPQFSSLTRTVEVVKEYRSRVLLSNLRNKE